MLWNIHCCRFFYLVCCCSDISKEVLVDLSCFEKTDFCIQVSSPDIFPFTALLFSNLSAKLFGAISHPSLPDVLQPDEWLNLFLELTGTKFANSWFLSLSICWRAPCRLEIVFLSLEFSYSFCRKKEVRGVSNKTNVAPLWYSESSSAFHTLKFINTTFLWNKGSTWEIYSTEKDAAYCFSKRWVQ